MEQKYYAATDLCMEVANHPGTLTKDDIINNIARLLQNDGKKRTESQLKAEAEKEYLQRKHRYEWMVGAELNLASEETTNRIEQLREEESLSSWWFETYANLD
jgi:hypothetical protein